MTTPRAPRLPAPIPRGAAPLTCDDDDVRARAFRYACEDCAHFVPDFGLCANGYPNAEHRHQALAIVFCKEFELA